MYQVSIVCFGVRSHSIRYKGKEKPSYALLKLGLDISLNAVLKLQWELPAVKGKELKLSLLKTNCLLFLLGDCSG